MSLITHIVVPTDFSDAAASAVEYAAELAQKFSARLTLLHVCEIPTYAYSLTTYVSAEFVNAIEEGAQKKLDDALLELKKHVPGAQGQVVSGPPGEMIRVAVADLGADLIVMGTHGRRGLGHIMLGSVAEKSVRVSTVPVLVVHAKAETKST